jgi:two-component system, NtrC family, sensor kinase
MDAISLAMRNQARSGDAERTAVSVREVVQEALLLCRSRLKVCAIEADAEEVTILADPTALGQLVMNLVSNAADAVLEGRERNAEQPAKIALRAHVEAGHFALQVDDSGPGVPDDLRARILEPFFTTKPRGLGTGIGLAIVQRVVKQHGGTLAISRSETLGGARFLVRWSAG